MARFKDTKKYNAGPDLPSENLLQQKIIKDNYQQRSDRSQDTEQYLTVQEVAKYLNIKISSVYAKLRSNEITHYRIGNLIRFKKIDIDAWMEGNRIVSKSLPTKTPLSCRRHVDVDSIVGKAIDASRSRGYNAGGKSDHVKGLRKEVKNGTV